MPRLIRPPLGSALVATVVSLLLGCGSTDSVTGVTTATLEVTTLTQGAWADQDGYQIRVDSGPAIRIGINSSISLDNLSSGPHTVELADVAAECTLVSSNPVEVQVARDETSRVSFNIVCQDAVGSIEVKVVALGGTPPESLTIQLDNGPVTAFAASDTFRFASVPYGDHRVTVVAPPGNCLPGGFLSTQTVTVRSGRVGMVFTMVCNSSPVGQIQVTLATSVINWGNYIPTGFRVTLDNAVTVPIGANGSVTFTSVAAGTHVLQVTAPSFCGASFFDTNRKQVTVTGAQTALVSFRELCIG